MNELTMKTREVVKEACKMKEILLRETLNESVFMGLDTSTLNLMQNCLQIYDDAMELAEVQAKVIDDINNKLDELLKLMGKES